MTQKNGCCIALNPDGSGDHQSYTVLPTVYRLFEYTCFLLSPRCILPFLYHHQGAGQLAWGARVFTNNCHGESVILEPLPEHMISGQ